MLKDIGKLVESLEKLAPEKKHRLELGTSSGTLMTCLGVLTSTQRIQSAPHYYCGLGRVIQLQNSLWSPKRGKRGEGGGIGGLLCFGRAA